MADSFFPSDAKGWLDLGTQVWGVVDDINSRSDAINIGQEAGKVAGRAPGRGIDATNQMFDEFGRPTGPDLDFQGFGGNDLETLRNELFSAGQLEAKNIADTRRQEVLQTAENMGLPSGLIAQQNALIDKWEQETVGKLAADVDNRVASILQTQQGQQNLFGLEMYDRDFKAGILPFQMSQNYADLYGRQALAGVQGELAGTTLGGEFTYSAGRGAAGLIDSVGGSSGLAGLGDSSSNVYGGVNLDNPMGEPGGVGSQAEGTSSFERSLIGGVLSRLDPTGGRATSGFMDTLPTPEEAREAKYAWADTLDPAVVDVTDTSWNTGWNAGGSGNTGSGFSGESLDDDTSFEGMGY